MTISSSVEVDVSEVVERLKTISNTVPEQMIKALNFAAFQLRRRWKEAIVQNIDKPSPFTTRKENVVVDQAKGGSTEATVRVNDAQARYLNFIVRGLKRQGSDIAAVGGQVLTPVRARLTKQGGLPEGPPRWLGTLKDNISGGVLLTVNGRRAAYQRQESGGLKLLAVFQQSVQYEETLPLFDVADDFSPTFISILNDKVTHIINRS